MATTTKTTMKSGVPVTMRALIQRINRKLAPESEVLKAARGAKAVQELGDFYAVDVRMNVIAAKNVDPEEWGRELGVLRPWEKLAD